MVDYQSIRELGSYEVPEPQVQWYKVDIYNTVNKELIEHPRKIYRNLDRDDCRFSSAIISI